MKFLVMFLVFSLTIAQARDVVEEGAYIYDMDKSLLQSMTVNTDLVFDHVSRDGFEVYGPKGLLNFLENHKIPHVSLSTHTPRALEEMRNYPSPEQINAKILELHAKNPSISKVFSIGRSVQGREILAIKISDNVEQDELEPEFKYISSMHGDEITGRELMVYLIDDIISNYGVDERITNLVNNTEIYIVASMNPDGSASRRRGNANFVDLNRNFPDFSTSDNQNTPANRQPETQAVMEFQKQRNFALSANFHGGAEVMNYAWDTIPDRHPLHDLLVQLSLDYANRVDYMKNSNEFQNGITNGYAWYEVNNGMQDWSYHWHNDLQFTVELSIPKWPSFSRIPYYYEKNRDALIAFIEKIHLGGGVKYKFIENGVDIAANLDGMAEIYKVENGQLFPMGNYPFFRSEFYKVLPQGEYRFVLNYANGYRAEFTLAVDGRYSNYAIAEVETQK